MLIPTRTHTHTEWKSGKQFIPSDRPLDSFFFSFRLLAESPATVRGHDFNQLDCDLCANSPVQSSASTFSRCSTLSQTCDNKVCKQVSLSPTGFLSVSVSQLVINFVRKKFNHILSVLVNSRPHWFWAIFRFDCAILWCAQCRPIISTTSAASSSRTANGIKTIKLTICKKGCRHYLLVHLRPFRLVCRCSKV